MNERTDQASARQGKAIVIRRGAFIFRSSRAAIFAGFGLVFAFSPLARSVTLAWDPSTDPTVIGYFLYYGTKAGIFHIRLTSAAQRARP
jgi:hypothetical protein